MRESIIIVVGDRRCSRGVCWGSGAGGAIEVPLGDCHYYIWEDGGGVDEIVSVVDEVVEVGVFVGGTDIEGNGPGRVVREVEYLVVVVVVGRIIGRGGSCVGEMEGTLILVGCKLVGRGEEEVMTGWAAS